MNDRTTKRRARQSAPPSRWLVLIVMCVGYFLVLLDVTVINVALPQIGASLGSSVSGLQWVVDGYALALAALLLTGGTVGDLRGHKPVVLAGLAVFALASLASGLAPSTGALIAARGVQGAGAALLLPGTLAIISRSSPSEASRRGRSGSGPESAASLCRPGHCSAGCWSRVSAGDGCSSSTSRSCLLPA